MFLIGWHEELSPDCKTPQVRYFITSSSSVHYTILKARRLTGLMKHELVKSLRTVVFLAMFSQDSTTVSNIQSCLTSMSVLEPALILHPILERAVPSLEALVEVCLKYFLSRFYHLIRLLDPKDARRH